MFKLLNDLDFIVFQNSPSIASVQLLDWFIKSPIPKRLRALGNVG